MLLGGTKANDYTDDEFDAELEKDMDAGENPTTKTVAPGNIKNDSTDEKDQKYLAYLKSIMDEKQLRPSKTGKLCNQSRRCPLYDSRFFFRK